jgi:hypothetical protein
MILLATADSPDGEKPFVPENRTDMHHPTFLSSGLPMSLARHQPASSAAPAFEPWPR